MDSYQQTMDQYADTAMQTVAGAGTTLLKLLQSLAETGYEALRKFGDDRRAKEKADQEQNQPEVNRKFSADQIARNQAAFFGFNNIFSQAAVPVQQEQQQEMFQSATTPQQTVSADPTAEKPDYQKILDQIFQTMKDTGATISAANLIELSENYSYEEYMGLVEDGLAGFNYDHQNQEMDGPEINLTKLCSNQEISNEPTQENVIDVTEIDDIRLSECIGTPLCFAVPELGMVQVDIALGENGLEINARTMDGLHELDLTIGEDGAQMDINALGGVIKGEIAANERGQIHGDVKAFDSIQVASADLDFGNNGQNIGDEVSIGRD